ncbi:MAG: hypothetical protein LC745_06315, partial [Planctomycetia bacterium]|nr:hypothetical protein [Planctomycetia bacterium]
GIALWMALPRSTTWAGWVFVLAQWLGVWVAAGNLLLPGRERDRLGLSVLCELARTWPQGTAGRLQTWIVATPDLADLATTLGNRFRDGLPTLALAIDAPGTAPELLLAGSRDATDLVATAASALWVPHRRVRRIPPGVGHSGFRGSDIPCVSLFGTADGRTADPAALVRVAHLVTEVALRWGKLAASDPQEPGESPARSSQNRG